VSVATYPCGDSVYSTRVADIESMLPIMHLGSPPIAPLSTTLHTMCRPSFTWVPPLTHLPPHLRLKREVRTTTRPKETAASLSPRHVTWRSLLSSRCHSPICQKPSTSALVTLPCYRSSLGCGVMTRSTDNCFFSRLSRGPTLNTPQSQWSDTPFKDKRSLPLGRYMGPNQP
jgi:hypothetical protein